MKTEQPAATYDSTRTVLTYFWTRILGLISFEYARLMKGIRLVSVLRLVLLIFLHTAVGFHVPTSRFLGSISSKKMSVTPEVLAKDLSSYLERPANTDMMMQEC